jgi:hypothetical protein
MNPFLTESLTAERERRIRTEAAKEPLARGRGTPPSRWVARIAVAAIAAGLLSIGSAALVIASAGPAVGHLPCPAADTERNCNLKRLPFGAAASRPTLKPAVDPVGVARVVDDIDSGCQRVPWRLIVHCPV